VLLGREAQKVPKGGESRFPNWCVGLIKILTATLLKPFDDKAGFEASGILPAWRLSKIPHTR
jgi:hypothetical protein